MTATYASDFATELEPDPHRRRTVRIMLGSAALVGALVDLAVETRADGVAAFTAVTVLAIALATVGGVTTL